MIVNPCMIISSSTNRFKATEAGMVTKRLFHASSLGLLVVLSVLR